MSQFSHLAVRVQVSILYIQTEKCKLQMRHFASDSKSKWAVSVSKCTGIRLPVGADRQMISGTSLKRALVVTCRMTHVHFTWLGKLTTIPRLRS